MSIDAPRAGTEFKDTTTLVVGGAGFVGSNLVRAVLAGPCRRVIVVDNLLSAERENLPSDDRLEFIEASINDDDVLRSLPEDLDYAFHLATYHGNQSSIADPIADHEHNTLTSLKLFERLKDLPGLTKVVYAGAGCTVAEKTFESASATQEDAPVSLHLDSPYQISKVIGEFYANYYWRRHGLPVVKARFQNVYGPGEVLGAGQWRGTPHTVWRNVVPSFIYRGLKGMGLTVENGGVATRDFIHVFDLVQGLLCCATRGGDGDVFNLASGVETSIMDLAEAVNRLTENPTPIDYLPARDWDRSGKRFGSTGKSESEIGFRAGIALEPGLASTVAWTREHLDRIDDCIRRHEHHLAVTT
ncbi:MAG: NAD-dependent epimerase/dehydratase family protein [Planctomycetes bacterium]|nr:NAD-dependent epimerase/dehydratase family protein [Planctomycetota bacterium]